MNRIILLLRVVYWGVIAYLPFALQYQHVEFTSWAISNPDAEKEARGQVLRFAYLEAKVKT